MAVFTEIFIVSDVNSAEQMPEMEVLCFDSFLVAALFSVVR